MMPERSIVGGDPLDKEFASATLQTALEFLIAQEPSAAESPRPVKADPGLPVTTTSSSDDCSTVSPPSKTHNKTRSHQTRASGAARSMRIRNHGQRKAELEYLRLNVKRLEARLERLQHASEPQSPSARVEDDHSARGLNQETSELAATWKIVAVRQFKRRRQAEMENLGLKRALANELKVSKALDRFLARLRRARCCS